MLFIEETPKLEMIDEAIAAYPDECCGFFFGKEEGDRYITISKQVNNNEEGDKKKRFSISPIDYLKAEQFAEENNLQLLGIYHSHPNYPAIPSETDRLSAQPYFSYVIISVNEKLFSGLRSWKLNDDHQFVEEEITFLVNIEHN